MNKSTIYSYYYSKKQYDCLKRMAIPPKKFIQCFFKGIPYTECVKIGAKSKSTWDDSKLIGIGTAADETHI